MEVKLRKTPFVNRLLQNENGLLNLARISATSKKSPSEMVGIEDELTAFEFDAACAWVLGEWENKREAARINVQLQAQAIMWGADPSKFQNDESDDDDEI